MPEPNPPSHPAPAKERARPGPIRWAIAIILLALAAWAGWHTYKVFGQRTIVQHIDELGGMVTYDFEDTDPETRDTRPSGPSVIAGLLGNDYSHDVIEVNLSVTERDTVSDEDLEEVSKLTTVRALSISKGDNVTDEGLAALANMPGLRRLNLSRFPNVTDGGLAVLAKLPELRELRLSTFPKITDQGLQHASGLANLKQLTIVNCPINGSGWEHLPTQSLVMLDASTCEINDAALKHLAKAARLDELSVAQNKIQGAGLADLKGLSQLTKLRLGENPLDPAAAVAALKELSSLELLTLVSTPIGRKEGEELSKALPKCDITITGATYSPDDGKWVTEGESQE